MAIDAGALSASSSSSLLSSLARMSFSGAVDTGALASDSSIFLGPIGLALLRKEGCWSVFIFIFFFKKKVIIFERRP